MPISLQGTGLLDIPSLDVPTQPDESGISLAGAGFTGPSLSGQEVSPEPEFDPVSMALEGVSINIGPISIPLDKDTAATFVGMGHMMSDTYRGAKQLLGVDIEEEKANQAIMNQLYAHGEYGGNAFGGAIVGAIAEPVTLAFAPLKLAKATKIAGLVKAASAAEKVAKGKPILTSAAIGATIAGAGYADEEAGQTHLTNAVYGGLIGGALSSTLMGILKGTKTFNTAMETKTANTVLDQLEYTINKHRIGIKGTGSKQKAIDKAYQQFGLSEDAVAELTMKADRQIKVGTKAEARGFLEGIESQATARFKKNIKSVISDPQNPGKLNQGWMKVKDTVDEFIEPMTSTMKKISTPIYRAMKNTDRITHERYARSLDQVAPFLERMNKLDDASANTLAKALTSESTSTVRKAIVDIGGEGMYKEYKQIRSILDKLHAEQKGVGYNLPKIKEYWPRVVDDIEGLSGVEHFGLKGALDKAREANGGRALSPKQVQGVITNLTRGGAKVKARTGKGLEKRTARGELDDEIRQYYASPQEALVTYLRTTIDDIETRKMFKALGYKGKPDPHGYDLNRSAQSTVDKHLLDLSPKEQRKALNILTARYGSGEAGMNRGLQTYRNVTNMVLLGNPISALTQFGDLAFTAHKYGYINSLKSIFGEKYVKKEMLGLLNVAEELVASKSKTQKALNWALDKSQFVRVDRLGKEAYLNAALKHYKKQVTSGKPKELAKFNQKWSGYFDADEMQVVTKELQDLKFSDVRKGNIPEKVKEVLWHEITDVQPVAKSELPLKYAQHPNGRILYMLRSFTIKQFDYMRRLVSEAPNKKEAAKAFAHFALLFTAANTGIDVVKDIVQGKEIDIEHHAVDNMLSMVGGNKYALDSVSKEGPWAAAVDYAAPPGAVVDIGWRAYQKGEPERLLDYIPVGGKLIRENIENR